MVYWYITGQHGAADLRLYIVITLFTLISIPFMMLFFPSRYTRGTDLLVALAFYGASKVFEKLDKAIFKFGHIVSGHTLKHVASAVAIYWILRMLKLRHPVAASQPAVVRASR